MISSGFRSESFLVFWNVSVNSSGSIYWIRCCVSTFPIAFQLTPSMLCFRVSPPILNNRLYFLSTASFLYRNLLYLRLLPKLSYSIPLKKSSILSSGSLVFPLEKMSRLFCWIVFFRSGLGKFF